jgi:Putative F0F1-ATPase subunit Ca2+/Mg2+ transporter
MEKDQPKGASSLAKYSSMGVELVLVLCLAAWLGRWLDARYQVESGLYTIFLMLFALVGSMYRLIKRLMHEQDKK